MYAILDINECVRSPCKNGGVCVNQPGHFDCYCTQDYLGALCEGITYNL